MKNPSDISLRQSLTDLIAYMRRSLTQTLALWQAAREIDLRSRYQSNTHADLKALTDQVYEDMTLCQRPVPSPLERPDADESALDSYLTVACAELRMAQRHLAREIDRTNLLSAQGNTQVEKWRELRAKVDAALTQLDGVDSPHKLLLR
ncbi:MAG: hypothetical protein AAGF94_06580 [Pseudomonadota bacterium]